MILYKNKKKLCIDLLYLLVLVFLGFGLFYFLINNSSTIVDHLKNLLGLIASPSKLKKSILDLICIIFYGIVKYIYYIIPLIIIFIFLFVFIKHFLFKKRCKDILNKIIKDLNNSKRDEMGIMRINEDQIYYKYFVNYGVNYKEFIKKYLPELKKF